MDDEIEGIKELIAEYVKSKKKASIQELVDYLFLDEKIVWQAIDALQDEGAVFMPDERSLRPVEKF